MRAEPMASDDDDDETEFKAPGPWKPAVTKASKQKTKKKRRIENECPDEVSKSEYPRQECCLVDSSSDRKTMCSKVDALDEYGGLRGTKTLYSGALTTPSHVDIKTLRHQDTKTSRR